jgi:SAM-dependent methyltransferase
LSKETEQKGRYLDWNSFWSKVNPDEYIISSTFHDRILLKKLTDLLKNVGTGRKVLEVGSTYSKTLKRLAEVFERKFFLLGVDNCEGPALTTGRLLKDDEVQIICADIFSAPLKERSIDMIMSFGLVEHFEYPMDYLHVNADLLTNKGLLVLGYPLYHGLTGAVQKAVNGNTLEYHFTQKPLRMKNILEDSGFDVIECRSFGLFNPNMIDWGRGKFTRLLMYLSFALIRPVEYLCEMLGIDRFPAFLSSYVIAIARLKG